MRKKALQEDNQRAPHTDQDKEFMRIAIEVASTSAEQGGGPFGAVIVKDGQIVAKASNSVTIDKDATAHAEVNAIRMACKTLDTFDLSGCTLYTSCEPCPMCLGAIYWAKIDRIIYGNTRKDVAEIGFADDFIYEELMTSLPERKIPIVQLLPEEAKESFRRWTENSNKTAY